MWVWWGGTIAPVPGLGPGAFSSVSFFFFSALFLFLTQRQALEHRLLYSA